MIHDDVCSGPGYGVMMNGRERWAFLFLLGLLLFNWPFLEIFSDSLPYYIFGCWGLYILVVKLLMSALQRRGE